MNKVKSVDNEQSEQLIFQQESGPEHNIPLFTTNQQPNHNS